ncbi:hypothetical protein MAGR_71600 [Mycolicibacterium agri]|uniref:DUF222 domain-containing protein n=1 Tax=Mycolicibacterium agri TaxID=36811 RepID=A0A7I9WE31_MYCAG|nr:hypothetical protein MAGR_71600 [Mycolicibacterium agri]
MTSTQQEEIGAALDAIDAGYARLRAACSDTVGNAFRVKVAERLETQCRINRGQMYRFFGELAEPPDGPDDPALPAGAVISKLLWKRLRITTGDVKARMKTAVRIRPRRTLTGQELEPELAHLAAAVESGHVGHDHIKAVCEAMDALPSAVPEHIKERAERVLVRHAKDQDSKFVVVVGREIAEQLNPDGDFDEKDRARMSGIRMGRQRADGMSHISGWVDPEGRAYLEAAEAAVRPGRHLPDGSVEEVQLDTRSAPQRLHDALKLGLKAGIASGISGNIVGCPSPSSSRRR